MDIGDRDSVGDRLSLGFSFDFVLVLFSNWRSLTTTRELKVMALSLADFDKVVFAISDNALCSSVDSRHEV